MWRKADSVALVIYRKKPELRFLLVQRSSGFTTPPSIEVEEGGDKNVAALRLLKEIGPSHSKVPKDSGHRSTYYVAETKFIQMMFSVEVDDDIELNIEGAIARWVSFEEALRTLTLTSHKKGLIRLLSEVVDPDAPIAHPTPEEFDHVPVRQTSGTVVLSDFDGTVTDREPSVRILKAFTGGSWERYEKAWLSGELTTHECLGYQFTLIDAPMEELVQYAAENSVVRDGFSDFVSWCREKGHGLAITSMGVDFYIKAILEKNGLGEVPYIANRAIPVKGMGLVMEEGMVNEDCDECSNCKTRLIEMYQASGAKVVFVGDGLTDRCPAKKADLVFARRELLSYCEKEGIGHVPFRSFDDVREGMEKDGP